MLAIYVKPKIINKLLEKKGIILRSSCAYCLQSSASYDKFIPDKSHRNK